MNEPTISLCLIGKNELNYFLKEVLESATFVDEIIYVDTGSTDGTLGFLAENYPKVKIFHTEFNSPQDYTNAKNIAIEYATMDYILSTDCDEVFDEQCKFIKPTLAQNLEKEMWCLLGEHYIGDFVHKDTMVVQHVWLNRLFKNHKKIKYPENSMHGIPKYDNPTLMNFKCIHHYGFIKNMCDALRRYETNINDKTQDRDEFLKWQLYVMLTGQYPGQAVENYPPSYYFKVLNSHPEAIKNKFHIKELEEWNKK